MSSIHYLFDGSTLSAHRSRETLENALGEVRGEGSGTALVFDGWQKLVDWASNQNHEKLRQAVEFLQVAVVGEFDQIPWGKIRLPFFLLEVAEEIRYLQQFSSVSAAQALQIFYRCAGFHALEFHWLDVRAYRSLTGSTHLLLLSAARRVVCFDFEPGQLRCSESQEEWDSIADFVDAGALLRHTVSGTTTSGSRRIDRSRQRVEIVDKKKRV